MVYIIDSVETETPFQQSLLTLRRLAKAYKAFFRRVKTSGPLGYRIVGADFHIRLCVLFDKNFTCQLATNFEKRST